MKTLLVIFAHPDDESFGPGSTLAKYARQGVQVHYLCATRGEAGTVEPGFLRPYTGIAELRTAELSQAARELGLASVHFLDYRDSGMPGALTNQHPDSLLSAPLGHVARRIGRWIQYFQPDAIITHDRYGWYGHPDHIKCYQATLRAYELLYGLSLPQVEPIDRRSWTDVSSGPNIPRLYASTVPKWVVKLAVRLLPLFGRDPHQFGQNRDVDLVKIASWEVPVTTRIDVGAYVGVRRRAAACHTSQRPLTQPDNFLFRVLLEREQNVETFCRLYPAFRPEEPVETGLSGQQEVGTSAMTLAAVWAHFRDKAWLIKGGVGL